MSSKEIVALSEYEHVRERPTIYVGSVALSDEKLQIIREGKVHSVSKTISVGFYKMMNEIIDNAFDEAIRNKGKMPFINIHFNSKTREVVVIDSGEGFLDPSGINSKTGLSNVETAMTILRAGSNFKNQKSVDSLTGTNGVGASLVNMLSSKFFIKTINKNISYTQSWTKEIWMSGVRSEAVHTKRKSKETTGTSISFIPDEEIFKNITWDKEYVQSMMVFRNYLKNQDEILKDLDFKVFFDEEQLDLDISFIPEGAYVTKTKLGMVAIWPVFTDSSSISYVNGAACSGIHQKIFTDYLNENLFEYQWAQRFYETLIILNLPPRLVIFGDQNKTRFSTGRHEIENLLLDSFSKRIYRDFKRTECFKDIQESIDESRQDAEKKTIKKKKSKNKQPSHKYYPPSETKENLFIVEGGSALGSILQKRNAKTDAVYSLKGKIKNVRTLRDLGKNEEIIDIMSILGLDIDSDSAPKFKNVIIATDRDPDGIGHIASLIINFFFKWFPHVIIKKKLHILNLPLYTLDRGKSRNYFFTTSEFNAYRERWGGTNLRYLKGLGSLSFEDWEYVFKNMKVYTLRADARANHYLNVAFGKSAGLRKKWLETDEN